MISNSTISIFLLAASFAAHGDTFIFNSALTNSTGWAYNEKVDRYADGRAKFSKSGGEILSPRFEGTITHLAIEGEYTGSVQTKKITVIPVFDGALSDDAALFRIVADGSGAITTNHTWLASDNVHAFKIVSQGSAGVFAPKCARILFGAPPENLQCVEQFRDGCKLKWDRPGKEYSSRILVEKRVIEHTSCDTIAAWNFYPLKNLTNQPIPFSISEYGFEGIETSGTVQIAANKGGLVEIGSSTKPGAITILNVPPEAEHLMVRASRPSKNYGTKMPLEYVADGATNLLETLKLNLDSTEYLVDLSCVPAGSDIIVNSTTTKTPGAYVYELALIRDYQESGTNYIEVARINAGKATSKTMRLDVGGTFRFTVESLYQSGEIAGVSAPLEVSLSRKDDKLHLGLVLILR